MQERQVTCTVCPIGCEITVKLADGKILEVTGSQCERGHQHAMNETLHPVRILTTTVKAENFRRPVVSVRSNKPIPKGKLLDCMELLRTTKVAGPLKIGQPVIKNILDTGADIIITAQS